MPKRGRPSKYPSIDLMQAEVLAGLGLKDDEIAIALGVSPRTLENYKKKPEFLQSLKRGKLKADMAVTRRLYERATVDGDTTAIIFWLKNRRPDIWRDKYEERTEIAGSEDSPVKVQVEVIYTDKRPEE